MGEHDSRRTGGERFAVGHCTLTVVSALMVLVPGVLAATGNPGGIDGRAASLVFVFGLLGWPVFCFLGGAVTLWFWFRLWPYYLLALLSWGVGMKLLFDLTMLM